MTTDDPHAHDAPLLHLVRQLHQGRTLRDNVRRLRWRRKRPTAAAPAVQQAEAAVNQQQQTL